MRGKANRSTIFCTLCGITPAYAGKRFEQGDKTYNVHGSPPPMRGKDNQIIKQQQELGITPAYAGKSCKVSCSHRLL